MQYRYFLLFLVASFLCKNAQSQLVAPNVFLQGHWAEVGIATNGSFGPGPAPAGYHPYAGTNLAMVYDGGHDGWTVGTPPFWGDYVYPGTPFEGWCMQAAGARMDAFYTDASGTGFWNAIPGVSSLTGSNTAYSNTGGIISGVWEGVTTGTSGGLTIRQTTRLDTEASWVVVTTVITNTSAADIPDVYYERTSDPDNSETRSSDFTTLNIITFQNDIDHRVMAGSYGPPGYHDAYMSLATKDCRAKAMIYQSWPPPEVTGLTLDSMYSGGVNNLSYGTYYYTLDTTTFADIAIGLIYKLGTIRAGDSTILSYAYIWKDSTCIDSAFPEPALVVNNVTINPSGPAPAPTYDTFNVCDHPGMTSIPVSVINATDKCWSWSTWTWSPSTGLSSTTGVNNTVTISSLSGAITYTITGTDSAVDMYSCNNRVMYLTVFPCFSASNNGPVCISDTLWLVAHGDSTDATYFWYGPGGFTAFTQKTYRLGMTMADTGWYYVVKTVGSVHDTAKTHVMLKPLPVVTATTNAPICSGSPNVLNLFASPDSVGETFDWSGPNGYTSTLENPSMSGPPVRYSGIYKVKTSLNGCLDSGFVTVVIDTTPARPVVSNNSPLCSPQDATHGNTLLLTATDVTPAVVYSWSGPGGFTSFLQNPSYPIVPTAASGTYTVTVSITTDGITCSNSNTTTVTIDSTPYLPILGSNAPICSGLTLLLSATSTTGSAYSWTGPNAFTSGLQNPSIAGATTAASGIYSVTATKTYPGITGGCISDMATLAVVVDSTPVIPTASSNSPGPPSICERDTLFLTANDATAGVTYTWVGPNSFTSTDENPMITNVAAAATGQYTVTATLDSACSASTVITVSITPTPTLLATNNGPVCTGAADTLFLQASSNPGATFSWAGPLVFLSNQATPFRTPVIMEMAGIYQVTAFLNGCSSLPVNDTVIVRQTPPPVWVKDTFYCQYSDVPRLQAFGDSVLWYPTRTPVDGTGSLTPPLFPAGRDTVMWFYVTQTVMNCESALDSFSVTIQPKPVVKVSPSVDICPHDSVLLVATDTDPDITYHWSPRIYLSDTTGATVISRPITNVTYQVVTTNQYNCHDTAYTSVIVNASAFLYLGDSVTLYPGETYQLNPQTNCTSFTWTPAAGLDNPTIANPVASPQLSTKYIVHGMTSWGCVVTDSINIYVDPGTLLSLPNAFSPGSGPNNSFKIIKRGIATLNYFRIFDRWGNMVFSTSNVDEGWDGTYKGVPQPFGVYVYEVSAVTNTGASFEKHGNVTLLR